MKQKVSPKGNISVTECARQRATANEQFIGSLEYKREFIPQLKKRSSGILGLRFGVGWF